MSPRLAVGEVSIASEGSAPWPPGSTMSPANDGALAPPPGAGGLSFAVALGTANTATPTNAASKSKRLIEVVLPRRIHTTRSRRAPAEQPGYDRGKSPANPTDESVSRDGLRLRAARIAFDGAAYAPGPDDEHLHQRRRISVTPSRNGRRTASTRSSARTCSLKRPM